MDIHKAIGYLPRPKQGWVLPGHKYTGPYNPLDEQLDENDLPIVGQEPFNKVDEISMRHDICYRDNPTGKKGCDDRMLSELDLLDPRDMREQLDKFFVKKVMGTKKKLGLGIKWTSRLANELHKPIKKKFKKRYVFVRNVDDIWAADLIRKVVYGMRHSLQLNRKANDNDAIYRTAAAAVKSYLGGFRQC